MGNQRRGTRDLAVRRCGKAAALGGSAGPRLGRRTAPPPEARAGTRLHGLQGQADKVALALVRAPHATQIIEGRQQAPPPGREQRLDGRVRAAQLRGQAQVIARRVQRQARLLRAAGPVGCLPLPLACQRRAG